MGGRDARKSEAVVRKRRAADAEVALQKLEAAHSMEALAAAIKAAHPFSSAASLQQALPAAEQRLAKLVEQDDKVAKDDFLSRVAEAERRDMRGALMSHPKAKPKLTPRGSMDMLDRYFAQLFQEQDVDHNGMMYVAAP